MLPIPSSTPARLEAFSDGVIAVIITIMVLELKVPTQNGVAGVRAILPTILVYALSFTLTGIYWINHRHLVDGIAGRIPHIDEPILYANLLLLFSMSLLPFFTDYLLSKHLDSFSIALYAAQNVVTGFSFTVFRLSLLHRLKRAGNLNESDTASRPKDLCSVATYAVAIPTALRHPHLALTLIAAVPLIWLFPNTRLRAASGQASHPSPTGI